MLGFISGCVNSIYGGEGSGKPNGTLSPPMSEGTAKPVSTSLAIVRIWGVAVSIWKRSRKRTGYDGAVLEGCRAEKTANIFPARVQHFDVWHECEF